MEVWLSDLEGEAIRRTIPIAELCSERNCGSGCVEVCMDGMKMTIWERIGALEEGMDMDVVMPDESERRE